MKKIRLCVSLIALLMGMAITKTSKAQSYPKNYLGIYFASGEFDLSKNEYDYNYNGDPDFNIYGVYYFKPGFSYARRLSKNVYLGIRTHKISDERRFREFFVKINMLTRYRFQPVFGYSMSGVKDYGTMMNLNVGFDIHIGSKMVFNTYMVGSLNKYAYNFNLGLNYKL